MRIGDRYQPISPLPAPVKPSVTESAAGAQTTGFGDQVKDAVESINNLQSQANDAVEQVATGNPEDTHKAVIAMEHSLMALDFTLQMRNKVLEAYQEIMRMQI